jgi:hypothetical protein
MLWVAVPGHHVFNDLQARLHSISFQNFWPDGMRLPGMSMGGGVGIESVLIPTLAHVRGKKCKVEWINPNPDSIMSAVETPYVKVR